MGNLPKIFSFDPSVFNNDPVTLEPPDLFLDPEIVPAEASVGVHDLIAGKRILFVILRQKGGDLSRMESEAFPERLVGRHFSFGDAGEEEIEGAGEHKSSNVFKWCIKLNELRYYQSVNYQIESMKKIILLLVVTISLLIYSNLEARS